MSSIFSLHSHWPSGQQVEHCAFGGIDRTGEKQIQIRTICNNIDFLKNSIALSIGLGAVLLRVILHDIPLITLYYNPTEL